MRSVQCGISAVLGLALLAGCATSGPQDRMLKRLSEVQSVAGEPVQSFHFWRLDRWEPLGREHLAIWTRLDQAYLIQVDQPCQGLDFANAVGLTSSGQRVYQRFDAVVFEHQRCRIAEIRPVDVKALRAMRRTGAPADPVEQA